MHYTNTKWKERKAKFNFIEMQNMHPICKAKRAALSALHGQRAAPKKSIFFIFQIKWAPQGQTICAFEPFTCHQVHMDES